MTTAAQRVAARYAMEHSSPEALKEYLTEHPKADPSKHLVREHGKEEGHGGGHGHDDKPKKSLKERMQALKETVKNLPGAAKKFVEDHTHRKEVMGKAGTSIKKSPGTYLKKLKETWDHEKHEFKETGKGIAAVMKGGKPTPEQKKAMKTVATHLAITTAAAALTSASPALAGLAIGEGLAKHIALKAVTKMLGDLHVLEELGHIGHGLHHVLDKIAADEEGGDEKLSPEDAFSALIMKKVMEQMDQLSDEDMADILEETTSGQEKTATLVATRYKVAARFLEAGNTELAGNFEDAIRELKKFKAWSGGFDSTLRDAIRSSSDIREGYVWQEQFVDFWKPFDPIERRLMDLSDEIHLNLDGSGLWGEASHFLDPPRGARIEDAISQPNFLKDSKGEERIAYPVAILEAWHKSFSKWVDGAIRGLDVVRKKARRKGLI